jgi:hypothetical protein
LTKTGDYINDGIVGEMAIFHQSSQPSSTFYACTKNTLDRTRGLPSKITLNEHRSFLAGLQPSIPLEPTVPRCSSSIADDWYQHCGRRCGLCTTATLSHGTLANVILADFHAITLLSRNGGSRRVVPGGFV